MKKNRREILTMLMGWGALAGCTQEDTAPSALWHFSFENAYGGDRIAMEQFIGKPLIVSCWATWCPPCVEELPILDSFYQENAATGWQVLGIALDRKELVRAFLNRAPVSFPMALHAGSDTTDLGKALGKRGSIDRIPFNAMLDAEGRVSQTKVGMLTSDDLRLWVKKQ